MTTKYTPGPWHRNVPPASKYPTIFSGRNTHVCILDTRSKTAEELEANADLIAAAPSLLEALRDLLAYHTQPTGFDTAVCMDDKQFGEFLKGISTNGEELADKARAAIAKAKGEQT